MWSRLLKSNYLRDSWYNSFYEWVAIFLFTIRHNYGNFFVQVVFQHLSKTVSRYFHTTLRAFATFVKEMIKPLSFDESLSEILKNM